MNRLIPFDLEKAKAGAKAVLFDGTKVDRLIFDIKSAGRTDDVAAIVNSESGSQNILRYYSNGHLISDSANRGNKDLMLIEEEDYTEFENKLAATFLVGIECAKKEAHHILESAKREMLRQAEIMNSYDSIDFMRNLLPPEWHQYIDAVIEQVKEECTIAIRDIKL